jgi:hypothetical protein
MGLAHPLTKQFYMHMLKSVGDRTRSEAMSKILSNMRPAHVESAAAAA